MRINVRVKLRAKEEKIKKDKNNDFVVWINELPIDGRANEAVIRILAGYFGISVSRIEIVSGHKSKRKTIEII